MIFQLLRFTWCALVYLYLHVYLMLDTVLPPSISLTFYCLFWNVIGGCLIWTYIVYYPLIFPSHLKIIRRRMLVKWKPKQYIVSTVLKSNWKIIKTGKVVTPVTNIHDQLNVLAWYRHSTKRVEPKPRLTMK